MKTNYKLLLLLLLLVTCSEDGTIEKFTLNTTVSPIEGGSISPSQGSFDSESKITLTATSSNGYVFENWSGDISGKINPITININSDLKVIANFKQTDTDEDGVTDNFDECPETEEGHAVDVNGCSNSQKDTDGDGIKDDADLCPDTLPGETVDANGCSNSQNDADNDGVADNIDQCDNSPKGETVDINGCSDSQKDTDGDGVMDDRDRCQNTPTGEIINSNGCSETQIDTDGDTITDDLDLCPGTTSGASVDANGCSGSQKDTDGDGVSDDKDQCHGTTSGASVDANGCSGSQKDTDGDGVSDDKDQCPGTTSGASVDTSGCTIVSKTYVPDDLFEQNLIYHGYDDAMDNYVLTENISGITDLTLYNLQEREGNPNYGVNITDYTGLEDFKAIEILTFWRLGPMSSGLIDLSNLKNLRRLNFDGTSFNNLNLTSNYALEHISFSASHSISQTDVTGLDLSNNSNLKSIVFYEANVDNLNQILSTAKTIEKLSLGDINNQAPDPNKLDLRNNIYLKIIRLIQFNNTVPNLINIQNGANETLEEITLENVYEFKNWELCFQVDNPSHVESIINEINPGQISYTVSPDCGY